MDSLCLPHNAQHSTSIMDIVTFFHNENVLIVCIHVYNYGHLCTCISPMQLVELYMYMYIETPFMVNSLAVSL